MRRLKWRSVNACLRDPDKYEAVKAQLKLALHRNSDPVVAQCKQAFERLTAAMKG